MRCPECQGDQVRIVEYDFGVCSQTGYRDAGERFQCSDCGFSAGVEELISTFLEGVNHG